MIPSRRTQPFRRGAREPGSSLSAMLKGGPAYLPNPMDAQRQAQKRRHRHPVRHRHSGLGAFLMQRYHRR